MLLCVGGCGCVVLLWTRSLKKCLYMIAIRVHTAVGTRARTRQSEHERQSPTTSLLGSEVTGEQQGKLVLHLLCMMSNVSPTLPGVQTKMGATQATKPNPPATEVATTTVGTCARTRQSEHERQSPTTSLLGSEAIGERQGKLVLHLLCMISNVSPTLSGVQTKMGVTQPATQNPSGAVTSSIEESKCVSGSCNHRNAYNWVACGCCGKWFHCCCVGVRPSQAKMDSFVFMCLLCRVDVV